MSDEIINVETTTETPEATITENATVKVEDTTLTETPEVKVELPEPIQTKQNLSDMLGEDFKESKNLHKFKDVQGLAKGYEELSSHLGKKFSDLTSAEMDMYLESKGRPEKVEDYNMGVENADPTAVDWFTNQAFEAGLSNDQATKLAASYTEMQHSQIEAAKTQRAEFKERAVDDLKQEYGSRMDSKLVSARKAMRQFAGEEFVNYLNETGLGDHPSLIKAFVNIGDNMLEDTLTTGEDATTAFGMSKLEVESEISKLYKDEVFMKQLKNPQDPHHSVAKEKFEKLYILKQSRK